MITDSLMVDVGEYDRINRPIKFTPPVISFGGSYSPYAMTQPAENSRVRGGLSAVVYSSGVAQRHGDFPLHCYPELAVRMNRRAEVFINDVCLLDNAGRTQAATYRVFDFLEERLFVGEFEFCNALLDLVDVNQCSTSVLRAFLVITAPAQASLPARQRFYDRVYAAMLQAHGAEVTQRLIGALG